MFLRSVATCVLLFAAPAAAQSDDAFIAWARGRIAPIDSFRTLDPRIREARLIGVGESVHESEPFLSFRLQLLQDLVRRHRVTALLLESGMPEAMAADDYVHGKTSTIDYDAALPGGYGALVEIRHTIEWLREWNLGEGRQHPVAVYGADLPRRSGSMVPALDRIEELTPGNADIKATIDALRPTATQISAGWWKGQSQKYDALPADAKAAFTSNAAQLVERVNRLSHDEWARRMAAVAQQDEEMLRLGAFAPSAPRDRAMTENTLWVLGRLPKGERAVYWAHNAHVQRAEITGPPLPPGRYPGAGMRFAAALGRQYCAIATSYGGPSLDNAAAAESGSVDGTLEKVAPHSFLLLLTARRQPQWLSEERSMRFQTGYLKLPLNAFDAVAYFDHASKSPRVP
jgi:erythromycin esterase